MRSRYLFAILTLLFSFLHPNFAQQQPIVLKHGGSVRTVAFSPVNGFRVASAGEDNTIKIWNLQKDTVITLAGHTGPINSIAFSPDGHLLVSGGDDHVFKLWHVHRQKNISTLEHIIKQSRSQVKKVSFSPDGQLLASAGYLGVKLWGVDNRAEIATLQHDDWVLAVAFSPNGRFLASGNAKGKVKVWDIQTQQVIVQLKGDTVRVDSLAFSPDGRTLASSGYHGLIKLWTVSDWTLLGTLQNVGTTYALDFSPDGKVLASTGHETVNLWAVESGQKITSLAGHIGWVQGVAFTPAGNSVASGGKDGTVRIQKIKTHLESQHIRNMVRLIYFVPLDRVPQLDIDAKLDAQIKDIQRFFANQLEAHGFDRKTFVFETEASGKAVVHHVKGRFKDAHYYDETTNKVWEEIHEQFDKSKNIYLIVIDIGNELIGLDNAEWCGTGGTYGEHGGRAILPASGTCFVHEYNLYFKTAAHELGHAFGLQHDFRNDAYLMSYGVNSQRSLSLCAAEWLDAHKYFNTNQTYFNEPTQIEMLPPRTVEPHGHGIRLRFKVTDPDRLHQAQLIIPTTTGDPHDGVKLHSCQSLTAQDQRIEFVTTQLITDSEAEVTLQVMDMLGDFTSQTFPLDTFSLLPRTEIVSISDPNLEASVRETLDLPPKKALTQFDLLSLAGLDAKDRQITDLTGLQHARNLRSLNLSGNHIPNISSLATLTQLTTLSLDGNQIIDLSPLADLTTLAILSLSDNQIVDLTPLSRLTNLSVLKINNNQIVNITPLTELTNLRNLRLARNQIVSTTPLTSLTDLTFLDLSGNQVSNITSLAKLIHLTELRISRNSIVDVKPLTRLANLRLLWIHENHIRDMAPLHALLKQNPDIELDIDISQFPEGASQVIVSLPDSNLEAIVKETLNLTPKDGLTQLDMLWLTGLDASGREIANLTGIEYAKNLKWLWLTNNHITDTTPLTTLVNLERLSLWRNQISNITPLVGLVNLEALWIHENHIRDMAPLHALLRQHPDIELDIDISQFPEGISKVVVSIPDANLAAVVRETLNLTPKDGLTQLDMLWLTGLDASGREIANLTGIEYAKNLKWSWLSNNHITDITPLTTLVNLERLSLWRNQISDITPLTNLKHLTSLWLSNNHILNITPLAKSTNLTDLDLTGNQIRDITPLANLTNLSNLEIDRNQISDVTSLTQLVNLKKLRLAENPIEDMFPLYALLEKISSINLDISHILYPLDKITGPWLWMLAPTETDKGGAASIDLDSLNIASSDAVTETDIAVNGANEGDIIGDYAWTLGEITEHGSNNVNDLANKIGFVDGGNPETTADDMDINNHSSYALITLESATVQSNVTMLAGSDDAIKIWLNGEIAHNNSVNRGAYNFQDIFKVDLKAGDNLLLVKVSELSGSWSMFVGIDADVKVKPQFTNIPEKIAAAPRGPEAILPIKTELLPNYPNPFNPETWIPYQLAAPTEVMVYIYGADGRLIRTLELGPQFVGTYESRSRAAYWDGRNEFGEPVASGVYFYTLTTGDFTATRKMLIRK